MSGRASDFPRKPRFVDPAQFTPYFECRAGQQRSATREVFCEGLPLWQIAENAGTPAYVYSRAAIASAYHEFDGGLRGLPHTICYAVKANGNLTLLKLLAGLGSGFDIVSGGELERLRRAGVRGDRIVFSGVGKTRGEIREALHYSSQWLGGRRGILLFNVESEAELEVLLEEASRVAHGSREAPAAAVRVNPDVRAGGHPHIATGQQEHKFGLDWGAARRLYLRHRDSRWIRWQGISAHIGSQVLSLKPFERALRKLADHFLELRRSGIELRYVDIGGGLGVRYTTERPPSRASYARLARRIVSPLRCHLLLEPGRSIVAQTAVLLTRVIYAKENRGKPFVIVDAAMNDMIRPSLYGAIHPITKVSRVSKLARARRTRTRVDIVGPVCETGDCFVHGWPLEAVESGELLAIWSAGAYGMVLSSNYNARPRAAEVLVDGKRFRIIRRRETNADLLRNEIDHRGL